MKAIVIDRFGAPEVLRTTQLPDPEPGPGEVRVRVGAATVSRTKDVAARAGRPPFAEQIRTFPHVFGTEHAGLVDAVGEGVDTALLGARVAVTSALTCGQCRYCAQGREEACPEIRLLGIHRPGSYAEFTVVPAVNVQVIPEGITLAQAASLAVNGGVAAAQLAAGGAGPDTTVLVLGAGGALGSTVAALAAFRGSRVIAVVRDPGRLAGLPLTAAIDSGTDDLAGRLRSAAGDDGIDCVIDNLGVPALWDAYLPALARATVVVVSGAITDDPVPLRFRQLYLHSHSIVGVRTGNRKHRDNLWAEVSAGFRPPENFIRPTPWDQVVDAHARIEAGRAGGQIVLEFPGVTERPRR
ncbi:alcohol dehydrogenase catalytic domain-containing protein [Kitasatospora sp. NBC_01250]|uniref:alcohol dehydrogenase catalytic domain-containing protein n=1 Tax=unclassified Kitasatospora TaxID=2633591 RepID=UPI002E14D495|nr:MULTISPECIES: alcohol dehydrogenase catalytic domain-containing protein [unclassified Kitasatospora]WSJ64625.1 alcohol dehydrogenase catalytic domain-containing protein [Kitasatospora sp. NBC_01302]WSJ71705.1 alcohol dehydrogenase catalytic domain-containing protein [Kitasatospora sp. NBC_01302]